jgi:tripartite-type tricarboxylate transporter receptor subunit TctC
MILNTFKNALLERLTRGLERAVQLGLLGLAVTLTPTIAQTDYPNKPLKIIVGFPPGQATDVIARLLAEKLSAALGQPVIIDNKPGQGGSIGAAAAAKAPADGYTLLLSATAPLATNPNLYKDLPYEPVRDFAPITLIANLPFVLVARPDLPANSVRELIALAKSKSSKLTYASSGNGSTSHLSMEMLKTAAGIDLLHVPYKGSVQAFTDVISGQVDAVFDTAVYALPMVKAGRVKLLAVAGSKRSSLSPDTPTVAEQGAPGYDSGAWLGMLFPTGTPRAIIARMNTELIKIVRTPEMTERLFKIGAEPLSSTPDEFSAHIKSELTKWGKAVIDSGVKVE